MTVLSLVPWYASKAEFEAAILEAIEPVDLDYFGVGYMRIVSPLSIRALQSKWNLCTFLLPKYKGDAIGQAYLQG